MFKPITFLNFITSHNVYKGWTVLGGKFGTTQVMHLLIYIHNLYVYNYWYILCKTVLK